MTTTQRESPPLQNGAVLLPEIQTIQTGNWVPQQVDASVEVCGVTWVRVYGGMGGRFDREDWVAVLPGISVSVHDYHWNGSDFGPSYGSFEDACREELKRSLYFAKERLIKEQNKIDTLKEGIVLLEGLTKG